VRARNATAVLFVGIGIGLGAGWVFTGVLAPPVAVDRGPASVTPLPKESDVALARERTARIEAEAARDTLAEELARSRRAPAPPAAETAPVGSRVPEAPSREAVELRAKRPDPARLAALAGLVREAAANQDQKRAVALLREIAALRRAGWPLAVELLPMFGPQEAKINAKRDPALAANPYDLRKVLTSDALAPLYADAISDAAHYSTEMRQAAATWLPSADPQGARELLRSKLPTEQDEAVANILIQAFYEDRDPDMLEGVVAAVRAQPNAAIRLTLTELLSENDAAEATRALESVAKSDPDEKVRQTARASLVGRNPPVAGVLVTQVVEGSQAARAGIVEGDIIVSYRGIPTLTLEALQEAKKAAQKDETVLLEIWRDGLQRVQLQAGSIGVNGRGVRPGNAPAPEGEDQDR
jgi:hypothetical protein